MRTVVVGGSNTVIKGGWLETFIRDLGHRGTKIDVAADMSVGNTTVGYGLFRIKEVDLMNVDLVVIEYHINDEFAYNTSDYLRRHWCRLYEGLIRLIRKANPDCIILNVALDIRNGQWVSQVPPLVAAMHYISAAYGTLMCDVHRELIASYGRDAILDNGFYAAGDSAHYARPFSTGMVGTAVATFLLDHLRSNARPLPRGLPREIDGLQAAGADAVGADAIAAATGAPIRDFGNWRFQARAVEIAAGGLRLRLKGWLLGIAYVCAKETSSLQIDMPGKSFRVSTMKQGVREGVYPFLTSYLPTEFIVAHSPPIESGEEYDLTITAPGLTGDIYMPRDGVPFEPHPDGEEASFAIIGLLHMGSLSLAGPER